MIQGLQIKLDFPLILGFESFIPIVNFYCILEDNSGLFVRWNHFRGTKIHIDFFIVLKRLIIMTFQYLCFSSYHLNLTPLYLCGKKNL